MVNVSGYFPENLKSILESLLPAKFNIFEQIYTQFQDSRYPDENKRINIFIFGIKMIMKNPLLGWGAASFPIYYGLKNNIYLSHSHNLILDTAFNYGLIVAILIFSNILLVCILSFKKILSKTNKDLSNNLFDRAWGSSFFILICSQMFDVQYYDLRISIAFWILLAGLKSIIEENTNKMTYTN